MRARALRPASGSPCRPVHPLVAMTITLIIYFYYYDNYYYYYYYYERAEDGRDALSGVHGTKRVRRPRSSSVPGFHAEALRQTSLLCQVSWTPPRVLRCPPRCPRSPRTRSPESKEPESKEPALCHKPLLCQAEPGELCARRPCCAVAWTPLQSTRPPATKQAPCPPRCQAPSLRQEDAWGLQARGALQARREGRLRFVRKEESWKTTVPIRLAGGCVLAMVCRRLKHLFLSCESTQNGIKGRCADPATSQRDTCEPLPSSAQRAESHRIRVSPRGSLARPPPELQQR
jgi:hypothetical protein